MSREAVRHQSQAHDDARCIAEFGVRWFRDGFSSGLFDLGLDLTHHAPRRDGRPHDRSHHRKCGKRPDHAEVTEQGWRMQQDGRDERNTCRHDCVRFQGDVWEDGVQVVADGNEEDAHAREEFKVQQQTQYQAPRLSEGSTGDVRESLDGREESTVPRSRCVWTLEWIIDKGVRWSWIAVQFPSDEDGRAPRDDAKGCHAGKAAPVTSHLESVR